MNNIKHERKASLFTQLLSNALYDLKDFDVTNVAINDIELSNDDSHAKVYVTIFKDKERYFNKLVNMSPFLRSVISKSWKYHRLPEIHFTIDKLENQAQRIENILKKIKDEN
ncbi:30S ribosome-binding factor RbfA [Mycoplasma zalophi]|uniref:Ribosome-binding factor A n=1 Tax=Mycoplasma zalophi TaxID=191287 RepID=A0ABS6DPJ4_9MOLU|nr:30S ribosome-binding factor RbfA [Mycoplasma zalophi]MBU4691028.1 30S ribosome-binding factor RbfA [Mycoplasma zalophi]MBU4692193.1 30S ribosome-binding factor RbfA [Mycoplasma zalophi]MCU4116923.1 30S ribosome-binding factor RbfA [Mycoplasma zalophi]